MLCVLPVKLALLHDWQHASCNYKPLHNQLLSPLLQTTEKRLW